MRYRRRGIAVAVGGNNAFIQPCPDRSTRDVVVVAGAVAAGAVTPPLLGLHRATMVVIGHSINLE